MSKFKKFLSRFSRRSKHRAKPKSALTDARRGAGEVWINRVSDLVIPIIAVGILLSAYSANILYRTPVFTANDFVVGQTVPSDIRAQVPFEYEDMSESAVRRQRAANQIPDHYRIDISINETTRRNFVRLFESIKTDRFDNFVESEDDDDATLRVAEVYQSLGRSRLDNLIMLFDGVDKQNFFLQNLNTILMEGVIQHRDLDRLKKSRKIVILDTHLRRTHTNMSSINTPEIAAKKLVQTYTERFRVGNVDAIHDIAQNVVAKLILPNLTYEATLTEKERKAATESVLPAIKRVTEGAIFMIKGSEVEKNDLVKLRAHNQSLTSDIDSREYMLRIVSLLILGLVVILMAGAYLRHQHIKICRIKVNVLIISIVLSINILMLRFFEEILHRFFEGPTQIFLYPMLPIAFSACFVAILINNQVGLSVGVFMSLLAALTVAESTHVFIVGLSSSFAGVLALASARTRTQTFRASLVIGIAIFIVEAIYLSLKLTPWSNYLKVFGLSFLNGFVVILLLNLMLPVMEYVFGIATNISLLELSDLNHPLLKRLQMEAPGTYHHTLMVAALSEHAAELIGANTLLTRVASYFHDIGKLANPTYFTENSFGVDRHEDLSPRMSALIILNHVKEGLALANKDKLKKPIRDVIASHHGTSLVYFFYQRAIQEQGGSENAVIDEQDFRYPGPLPTGKEASIISLADSCEAASRSLKKPTPKKIQSLVSEIIRGKILDGQLNDSELTMAEITIVEQTIVKTLNTMLHGRIAYPKVGFNEDNLDEFPSEIYPEEELFEKDNTEDRVRQRSSKVVAAE